MRISNAKAGAAIVAGESFDNSNSTLGGRSSFIGWGDVPAEHRENSEVVDTHIAYWVYSYDTPIAWVDNNGVWFMPPVRYSITTTNHQHLVARAIGFAFTVKTSLMKGHGRNGVYGSQKGGW